MAVTIRAMTRTDRDAWADMRIAMWPDTTRHEHLKEIDDILGAADCWAFIAISADDRPAGFAEVSIHKYVNGCTQSPVPFLEGIWVEPGQRRSGAATALIAEVERFFLAKGFGELCSDTFADNAVSRTAHRRWGFEETETVVFFRKSIHASKRR